MNRMRLLGISLIMTGAFKFAMTGLLRADPVAESMAVTVAVLIAGYTLIV